MEGKSYVLDPHDEVRRLQDKVRKLELQNEQLRTQQFSRNGLLENKQNVIFGVYDDYCGGRVDLKWDDHCLKPEELYSEDFQDEETWLNKASNCINHQPVNLHKWLHQDVENLTDLESLRNRRILVLKIEEIEQGLRRNSIDTRTFTRPKKRVTHTPLETMTESPILEAPWQRLQPMQCYLLRQETPEMLDDSLKCEDTLPSFTSPEFNLTFAKNNSKRSQSNILKITSETKTPSGLQLNTSYIKLNAESQDQRAGDADWSAISRRTDPMNTTFTKSLEPCLSPSKISKRGTASSVRNSQFFLADSNTHPRSTPSCDSGADDDQLSSASDSSFSSSTRLMNAGDVQTMARLQEESLKEVTSTPNQSLNKGTLLVRGDDIPSPIKRSSQDLLQGYLSDHSDQSSVEGRARSSRSSVRSSPSGSPFGSTNILTYDFPQTNMTITRRKEMKVSNPISQKQDLRKTESGAKFVRPGRAQPISGLRPPSLRPAANANRPPTVAGSSIPRPASRIPGPRIRSAFTSQAAPKVDWMDGCF